MTEHEKREKSIEEMAKIRNRCLCDCGKCVQCSDYVLSVLLYGADYRKADEVRKETAKEIRDMLLERLDAQENILLRFELAAMITKIETVFGVEVEE